MNTPSNKLLYGLVAIIIILLATSGIGWVSYQEQSQLDKSNLQKAVDESTQANLKAEQSEREAIQLAKLAETESQKAMKAQAEAEAARVEAEKRRVEAALAEVASEKSEANARRFEAEALRQRNEAERQANLGRIARDAANRARYISQGKAMAVKSTELGEDPQLEALIALQAYNFNSKYDGNPRDNDIYNGLLTALDRNKDPITRSLTGHSPVSARVLVTSGNEIYSGGSDGRILRWSLKDGNWKSDTIAGPRQDYQVLAMDVSQDAAMLLAGGSTKNARGYLELYDLKNPNMAPKRIAVAGVPATIIHSLKGSGAYVLDQNGASVVFTDFTAAREVIKPKERINAIALSSDGTQLAGAGADGGLYTWDLGNGFADKVVYQAAAEHLTAIALALNNRSIVFGNSAGVVRILNDGGSSTLRVLRGHSGEIETITFNHGATSFATASRDHTIRLWNWTRLAEQPIVLNFKGDYWARSMAFTADDGQLMTAVHPANGKSSEAIHVWPTGAEGMAVRLCSHVKRNLLRDEWNTYVGADLPYEGTCENQPSNNK